MGFVYSYDPYVYVLDFLFSFLVKAYMFLFPWSRNGCICDSTIVQLLFEVSQALYDATDFVNIKDDDNRQTSHLISRFVEMVP